LLVAAAAVSDLRTGLIPNRLVVAGFVAGLIGNVAVGFAMRGGAGVFGGLLQSLLGALACAPVPLFLFLVRGLAGGDVKLFIALGSLVGPIVGVQAQLYAFVVGALYVFGMLAYEGVLWRTVGSSVAQVTTAILPKRMRRASSAETQRTIRFAPAICLGTAIALFARWGTV
jgi:prepilin peptidase CpaA